MVALYERSTLVKELKIKLLGKVHKKFNWQATGYQKIDV